jgi:hypothetical protein
MDIWWTFLDIISSEHPPHKVRTLLAVVKCHPYHSSGRNFLKVWCHFASVWQPFCFESLHPYHKPIQNLEPWGYEVRLCRRSTTDALWCNKYAQHTSVVSRESSCYFTHRFSQVFNKLKILRTTRLACEKQAVKSFYCYRVDAFNFGNTVLTSSLGMFFDWMIDYRLGSSLYDADAPRP